MIQTLSPKSAPSEAVPICSISKGERAIQVVDVMLGLGYATTGALLLAGMGTAVIGGAWIATAAGGALLAIGLFRLISHCFNPKGFASSGMVAAGIVVALVSGGTAPFLYLGIALFATGLIRKIGGSYLTKNTPLPPAQQKPTPEVHIVCPSPKIVYVPIPTSADANQLGTATDYAYRFIEIIDTLIKNNQSSENREALEALSRLKEKIGDCETAVHLNEALELLSESPDSFLNFFREDWNFGLCLGNFKSFFERQSLIPGNTPDSMPNAESSVLQKTSDSSRGWFSFLFG